MQAETIELLSGKGKFSMEQALILAEAMDRMLEKSKFVTVPILDARIATVHARIDALEAKLDSKFNLLEGKFNLLEGKFSLLEVKFDAKFDRWTTRMIIAMVLSQTALGPIGMQLFESVKRVVATLGH